MSLSSILGSAMSGLTASQAGLSTVSNNIANVGTPGYARETVALTTGVTLGNVTGVVAGVPGRIADRFLEAAVYSRAGDVGSAATTANYLSRLQALLGAPGSASGLPARLDAIDTAAVAMTGSLAPVQTSAAFLGTVQDTILTMKQLDSDVAGLRSDAASEVSYTVSDINSLLKSINDLNTTIARQTGLGNSSAGAIDQRTSALEKLSGLINVSVRDQADGRVTIDTASGAPLIDCKLRLLSYTAPGAAGSQPTYPPIGIRFADASGNPGASTGQSIDSAAAGGTLGSLIGLRDSTLPAFSEKLGVLFDSLAQTLNKVSNAGTTVPAPGQLSGGQTALNGVDRAGFTGSAVFAVTKPNGELVASSTIDFAALMGGGATVDDVVAAINTGLGPAGTASFVGGRLTIAASAASNGVVVAQNPTTPSDRAGVGFSQYFGLNDVVKSADSPLVPSGFIASDPHGFGPGQTVDLVVRDSSGRELGSYTATGSTGPLTGDLVAEINTSPLSAFGSFALDSRGRIQFKPNASVPGAVVATNSDSTARVGNGQSFTAIFSLSGASSGLSSAGVRADMLANGGQLPLARLQTGVAVGGKALGVGDNRGAAEFASQLGKALDLGKDGLATTAGVAALLIGNAGAGSARATASLATASARSDDAITRRDNFSGVNIDEELGQMVVLQKSYSAAGRIISTVSDMYDTILAMVR